MSGPLVLMGIDAEDGGPGGHGPIAVWENIVGSIINSTTKAGSGVLVIGGGKNITDGVTRYWDTISFDTSIPVTYVNGAAAIATQSFSSFSLLAVSSSIYVTSGGLTEEENLALNTRKTDIANFVNSGGGLLGFSQGGLTTQYAYLGAIGAFTVTNNLLYGDIAPTAAGLAIGITDALSVNYWHDVYGTFPSFLQILATDNTPSDRGYGRPAAIGGAQVIIPTGDPTRGISFNFL